MSKYWDKRLRDREIVRLASEGMKVKEIAEKFKVNIKTVYSALKEVTDGNRNSNDTLY